MGAWLHARTHVQCVYHLTPAQASAFATMGAVAVTGLIALFGAHRIVRAGTAG